MNNDRSLTVALQVLPGILLGFLVGLIGKIILDYFYHAHMHWETYFGMSVAMLLAAILWRVLRRL